MYPQCLISFLHLLYRSLSRGKLSTFSDISQNSTLEKWIDHEFQFEKNWTLHKIQCEKNTLFTKFNSVNVFVFRKTACPALFFFSEVTDVPCPFLEIKNKCPALFPIINKERKPDSC